MSRYSLLENNDEVLWDRFVAESEQGSVFCQVGFIDSLGLNCKYYFVRKGDEVVAAIPILLDDTQHIIKSPYHFSPYISIMFKAFPEESDHKKISREFELTEFIVNEIIRIYGKFSITTSPSFGDIRPFLWHNYNSPGEKVFAVNVRYTPILKMDFGSHEEYLSSIRTLRRRELKEMDKVDISDWDDVGAFDNLHRLTFERQGIARPEVQSKILKNIVRSAIDKKFGRLSLCRYQGEDASAFLFLYDNKRAYYLFGANHPDFRKYGCSTKLMVENIFHAKDAKGLNEVDFVGANSPRRGDYKISFNSKLRPYFEIHYNV